MSGKMFDDVQEIEQSCISDVILTINQVLTKVNTYVIPIGSAASPVLGATSGDIDLIVDEDSLISAFKAANAKIARKSLSEYFNTCGFKTRQHGIMVHVRVPVNENWCQVDIMVVKNAYKISKFHQHTIPVGSPYKGIHKHLLIAALSKRKGYLWSAWQGLFHRTPDGQKGDFISNDVDQVAKSLLGDTATYRNIDSAESILESLCPDESSKLLNIVQQDTYWTKQ